MYIWGEGETGADRRETRMESLFSGELVGAGCITGFEGDDALLLATFTISEP
jgi:hypothetical protein